MTFFSLLSFLPIILIGYNTIALSMPGGVFHNLLFKFFLGIGAGVGISSSLYFFYCAIFSSPTNTSFLLIEIIYIVISLILIIRFKKDHPFILIRDIKHLMSLNYLFLMLIICLLIVTTLSILSFVNFNLANPHGYYDAYSIWNLHARMIYRGDSGWMNCFSPSLYHADYPLLIPTSIARIWSLAQQETIRAPMVLAGVMMFAVMGLLMSSLFLYQKKISAIISALILLSTTSFLQTASLQYADIPLAFYYLATGICMYQFIIKRNIGYIFLSALFMGYAGWTKNEGLLLILITFTFLIKNIYHRRNELPLQKSIILIICGALLPVLSITVFKIFMAPKNDLFIDQNLSIILGNITSFDRYVTIIDNLFYWAIDTWQITSLVCLMVFIASFGMSKLDISEKAGIFQLILFVLLIIIGYCGIYLITPWDLVVHMRTSANRLLLHIYPLLLFLVFLVANSPPVRLRRFFNE